MVSDCSAPARRFTTLDYVLVFFNLFVIISWVLLISPIGPGAVAYYFRDQGEGYWLGKGAAQLGLAGRVTRPSMAAALQGCHPVDRVFLPAHKPARRRAGWDLILAAPKSVSLLAESSDQVAAGHQAAVAGVVDHFESELLLVRRAGTQVAGVGLVAAAFDHRRNASGEPHLHTHLVVANLAPGPDGGWSHIDPGGWWPARRSLGAVYQLGLRHHLALAGLEMGWRLRDDGLADVAGVARDAIAGASSRRRAAAARETTTGARTRRSRAYAVIASRGPDGPAPPAPRSVPRDLGGTAGPSPAGDLEAAVTARLATERSLFRRADVFVALAATSGRGLPAGDAARWVDGFCRAAMEVPGGLPRWTTRLARAADDRFVAAARDHDGIQILASPPGRSNLLAHAAYLEEAVAGRTVRLVTEHPARWLALAGLATGDAGRPEVVVVDQADRRSTPELLALQSGAAHAGASLILVQGGTAGGLTSPRSHGLVRLAGVIGRVDPGPTPQWAPGRGPAGHLLEAWADRPDSVLVGLGPAEVDGLNQAARNLLVERGHLGGAAVESGGRPLQAGDRVVALRRLGGGIAPGRLLSIAAVDPTAGAVTVVPAGGGGDSGPERLERGAVAHLGYGYAVTPTLAASNDRPLLVLGRAESLGLHRDRVLAATRDAVARRDGLDLSR